MADRSRTLAGQSELEAREAEAEEARVRLARTLETLTGPGTRDAVKAEVLAHVQSYKDELMRQADRYKDELLRRADEYKGELLARAETYKGEIMERAEQYKGDFLHRADAYKNEALQRAEEYRNEVVERARESGRRTVRDTAADLKLRAKNNPAAVALIGAGIGWRLYKHPPIATLLIAAGTAMLINTPGRARRSEFGSDRHREQEARPQGSMPGRAAGYGSPVATDVAGSGTSEPMAAMATRLGEAARDAGGRLREAAHEAGSRISGAAVRTGSSMAVAAEGAVDRTGALVETAGRNPLLLGAAALAAGAAVANLARRTKTGDRAIRGGAEGLGRGVRHVASRANEAAHRAVEAVAHGASAAVSPASRLATSMSPVSSESAPPAPSRSRTRERSAAAAWRSRGMGKQASREVMAFSRRYPLLLGSLGLVLGAAAGVALRPTALEDRSVGRFSDAVRGRARRQAAGQLDKVLGAADRLIASVESRLGSGAGTHGGAEPQDDVDRTVVVERAADAAAAQASLTGKSG
jgi:hypothetical protein